MSNGSEHMSERQKITNWAEGVPLMNGKGRQIGRAKISDRGEIHASIDDQDVALFTFKGIEMALFDGLVISVHNRPAMSYTEEVRTRLADENPLRKKEQS